MMVFVDRFRYKASKARQAQSRLKAIAKLQPPIRQRPRHNVEAESRRQSLPLAEVDVVDWRT